jgi:hypothetical protein
VHRSHHTDPGGDWTKLKEALTPNGRRYEGKTLVGGMTSDGVTVEYKTVKVRYVQGVPHTKIIAILSCSDAAKLESIDSYIFCQTDDDLNENPLQFAVNVVVQCNSAYAVQVFLNYLYSQS